MAMTYTAVFVHAHPDDEALFTSGTMADLALQGHRVVLVVCTDGAEGLAAEVARGRDLAAVRRAELETSAEALGVTTLHWLGYGDSGLNAEVVPQPDAPTPLVYAPREDVVSKLADILRRESAAVVVGYDPNGGYGHPDHIAVHEIAYEAAAKADAHTRSDTAARHPRPTHTSIPLHPRLLQGVRSDDVRRCVYAAISDHTHDRCARPRRCEA